LYTREWQNHGLGRQAIRLGILKWKAKPRLKRVNSSGFNAALEQSKAKLSKAKQSKAKQSKAKQNETKQSKAKQSKAKQASVEPDSDTTGIHS
jgi:hypothetical protein